MPDLHTALRGQLARMTALGYLNAPTTTKAQEMWIAVMADDLYDIAPADIDAAFSSYRRSADPADRYMPTPGRIRALTPAAVMLTEAQGKSGDAWQSVVRASGNCRRAHELIRDPLTWSGQIPPEAVLRATEGAVAAVGGWEYIGLHPERERALAVPFRRAYEANLARQSAPHRSLPSSAPLQIGPPRG